MGVCHSKAEKNQKILRPDLLDEFQPLNFDILLSNIQGRNFKKKNTFLRIQFGKNSEMETHYVYESSNPNVILLVEEHVQVYLRLLL
jgi:hypothetical protein